LEKQVTQNSAQIDSEKPQKTGLSVRKMSSYHYHPIFITPGPEFTQI